MTLTNMLFLIESPLRRSSARRTPIPRGHNARAFARRRRPVRRNLQRPRKVLGRMDGPLAARPKEHRYSALKKSPPPMSPT